MKSTPLKQIHVGVVREDVAIGEIDAPLGHAETDAQRLIFADLGLPHGHRRGARHNGARAQRGGARIGVDEPARRLRLASPNGDDPIVGAFVGDRDLGAQLVDRKPLGEIGRTGAIAIEEIGGASFGGRADDEEVEQNLALRGQQRSVACFAKLERLDVVGQKIVKEAGGVLAADAHDAPVLEKGGFSDHGVGGSFLRWRT